MSWTTCRMATSCWGQGTARQASYAQARGLSLGSRRCRGLAQRVWHRPGCPVVPSRKSNGKGDRTDEYAYKSQRGKPTEDAEHYDDERNVGDIADEERS